MTDFACEMSKVICSVLCRIRELSAARIGTLLRISGQVVRTHPVHPELVSGTFLCLDCQSVIKDVEQQFKYTQPTICKNPVCANRRRFMLDTNKSRFVDFQKVRMWGFLTISATKKSPKKFIFTGDFNNFTCFFAILKLQQQNFLRTSKVIVQINFWIL